MPRPAQARKQLSQCQIGRPGRWPSKIYSERQCLSTHTWLKQLQCLPGLWQPSSKLGSRYSFVFMTPGTHGFNCFFFKAGATLSESNLTGGTNSEMNKDSESSWHTVRRRVSGWAAAIRCSNGDDDRCFFNDHFVECQTIRYKRTTWNGHQKKDVPTCCSKQTKTKTKNNTEKRWKERKSWRELSSWDELAEMEHCHEMWEHRDGW